MPNSVVKTPEQESKWNKAKKIASSEGKGQDYAYIMGIYKKMGGLDKTASFVSSLFGRDVSRAGKVVGKLRSRIADTEGAMQKATKNVTSGIFKKTTKEVPMYSRSNIKSETKDLYKRLAKAQNIQAKAGKAQTKAMIGTGVAGTGAFAANKMLNKKNPYTETPAGYMTSQQPMYTYASEKTAGVKDMWDKVKTIKPHHVLNEIKSIATGSGYKKAKQNLLDVNAEVAPATMDEAVKLTRAKKDQITNLEKKILEQKGFVTNAEGSNVDESIEKALKQKMNPIARYKSNKLRDYKDVIKKNEGLLEKQKGEVDSQISELQRKKDNELGKRIFGIGGVGAGVALGGKAIYDKNKKDK